MRNVQQINSIHFERTIYPFCPLGEDHYKGTVTVDFGPTSELFDFCDIDEQIQLLGIKSLIVEDLVDAVYQLMMKYHPKWLQVEVYAESNKHFPVTVVKHTN